MRPDRWQRVEALFADLVEQPVAARARLLDAMPPEDDDLREELSSLLACDVPGQPLERIIQSMAASALGPEEAEGGRLGSYRIIRKLGQGGMGTVYLAVRADDEYRQQVAIKVVTQGRETLQSVERFRRERQILASLEHPYIARLLDGGSGRIEGLAHDTSYLVMEFVEGEPVTDYCLRHELDVKGRLDLFLKICEAVAYAHRKLVVHRDLKPSNILITTEGSPRLLDFGIAKLLTEDGTGELTAVAGLAMTPDFASPEQVLQTQITTASDIYSLGAILYLLLTGVKPHRFDTLTPFEVRQVICDTEPQGLAMAAPHLRRQLQGDLEAIVSMAMRKEPEHRYSSVEQLSADLVRHLQGWPVVARQGNFRYRAGKYLRRNRTAIAAGVFIAGALAVGSAAATFEAVRASHAQARAEREREGAVRSQALAEASGREARQQAQEALRQREYADVERAEADTQRHAAERRFEQVHQLAGTFLLDFHDAIAKLPGATPARKMVVQTGLQYYDTLVKEAGNNRALLEEIANGYDRLGDVQGNPYYPNLGDTKGARASYMKALSLRGIISDPSAEFWRDSILGRVRLSQVAAAQDDLKGSERFLQEAFALSEKSPAADSFMVRNARARALGALGDLKMRAGEQGEALKTLQQLLDLSLELARETKDPREMDSGISLAHTKMGDVLGRMERAPEALTHLHLALEIDKRLSAAEPANMPLVRKVFIDYTMLGRVLRGRVGQQLGAPGEVNGYLEQASLLADRMAAADPDNRSALADVSAASAGLAERLRLEKKTLEAIPLYNKAVAAAERMDELAGHVPGNEDFLVQAHERLAGGLTDAGRYKEAFEHFAEAEKYLARTEKQNPGLSRNATRLCEILDGRAEAYVAQKLWDEAAATYRQEIGIFETQFKRDPANEVFLNERPHLYASLADCYAATSQWAAAADAVQTTLDRFLEIEARRPLVPTERDERVAATAKLAEWSRRRL